MSEFPARAKVVIIGAGIVGNSIAYHLANLGWTDILQIDKGPLPNPGGSTGHASNFIFPVDHSKEMTDFTLDSVRQYKELGVFTESGGIEVARTPERMNELHRRMASAKAFGIFSEVVSTFSGKPLFGYRSMVLATMAICVISSRPNDAMHQAIPERSIMCPINSNSGTRTASSGRDNRSYRDGLTAQK